MRRFGWVVALAISVEAAGAIHVMSAHGELANAEVCFMRAPQHDTNLREQLRAATSMRCSRAGDVELPSEGTWYAIARDESGYVTPGVVTPRERDAIAVAPAASVDLAAVRREDTELFMYLPETASIIHIPRRDNRAQVPAGKPVVLIETNPAFHPTAVTEALVLAADTVRRLTDAQMIQEAVLVSFVVRVPDEDVGIPPPMFAFARGAKRSRAGLYPVNAESNDRLRLQAFLAPRTERVRLVVDGDEWQRHEIEIAASPHPIRSAGPLTLMPKPPIRVTWSVTGGTPLARSRQSCDDEANRAAGELKVTFYVCPGLQPGNKPHQVASDKCEPAASSSATVTDEDDVVVDFQRLRPGPYLLEATYASFPTQWQTVLVTGRREHFLFEPTFFNLSGRITKGGEPLHAKVLFPTGLAFTDTGGRYETTLEADPGAGAIQIAACAGGVFHVHVPDAQRPPLPNSTYDIDVPDTTIRISVEDGTTRRPIDGAEVVAAVLETDSDKVISVSGLGHTDHEGVLMREGLPVGYDIRLKAKKEGYEGSPPQRVRFDTSGEREVTLLLRSPNACRGRIESMAGGSRAGTLFWVSRSGVLREMTNVQGDGTFACSVSHSPNEMLFFSGEEIPFSVLQTPAAIANQEEILLHVPTRGSVGWEVALSQAAAGDYAFSVVIDGVVVPRRVFFEHVMRRFGYQPILQPGGVLPVRSIAAARDLRIIAAPMDVLRRPSPMPGVDEFYLPDIVSILREVSVQPGGRVVIDP